MDDEPTHSAAHRHEKGGQSLVEFGLILPIMLVLFVAFADFGRIFANSVLLEAAARNAAELAANEYLANPPNDLSTTSTAGATYYDPLHLLAARAACQETRELPNTQYDTATATCPGMPLVQVCVHDGVDPSCAGETFGATIPANCSAMATPPTNSQGGRLDRWVEVRLCYRFTSLVDVPLVSFGEFWLERTRTFAIPCYYVLGTDQCG